ncbi:MULTISPECIES: flagellar motor protein MotD [unclassified Duganella]|jgi:chemotaxis protein MotB|uniref:flagellar motor protein MotD n=1 Tax=unclassified Duganella TaxID=2636909 RepID=UPI0008856227|nr:MULTISPECIES: flagellar motor protein MotD [unclassified Duganella]SDG02125.1 chemotaxis protein MotB [Duganella sp. OV458]SDJ03145.1 chemotaxis protein MotB [Duganella sp. OV510]
MQYRRARRKFDDEPENHERWLISYADFITLLFAFFVVMYAISAVNIGKYKVFSDALGNAFGGQGSATPVNTQVQNLPIPNPGLKRRTEMLRKEKEHMTRLAQDLLSTMAPLVKEGKVRVTQNSRGVSVEINASVLFDPGDARLMPQSVEALRAVASLLAADSHNVQVEGHTDNQPIANPRFPSNWELSAVRASSVVRLFIDAGVAPGRLSAVGFSANQPVAGNDTAEGRARNRRVAVTILSGIPDPATELPTP